MTKESRLAVIGGGIPGLWCAWHLATKLSAQVTLYEKNTLLSGASGHSLGVAVTTPTTPFGSKKWDLFSTSLAALWREIEQLEVSTGLLVPSKRGILRISFDSSGRNSITEVRNSHKETPSDLTYFSSSDLKTLFKGSSFQWPAEAEGLLSLKDGQVATAYLGKALKKGLLEAKGTLQENTQVVSILPGTSEVEVKVESEGKTATESFTAVVLTAGMELENLLQGLPTLSPIGKKFLFDCALRPVIGQALEVEVKEPPPLWILNLPPCNIIPLEEENTYWIGATLEPLPPGAPLLPSPHALNEIQQILCTYWPAFKSHKKIRHWWGVRPTPLRVASPIIKQHPEYPRIIVLGGFGRNGVLTAPGAALFTQEKIQSLV